MKPDHQYYDICVVGAGLSGAIIAEQYASQLGKSSLIIEKQITLAEIATTTWTKKLASCEQAWCSSFPHQVLPCE
jgi:choline dehydrogenase-like flavoprotein